MNKRKKKSRRRRDAAIRTFGLKGDADHYETTPLYQSSFQEGDMAWLADEYRRRSRSEPSLALETFAVEYGASADELRFYVSDGSREINRSVILWHGTTASRARSILREGFRAKKSKGRTFFTTSPSMARGHAQSRARGDDPPAVLVCSIDLSHYDDFKRRGREVYIFGHQRIDNEVIQKVERLPKQRRGKPEKQEKKKKHKDASGELTHVVLTFNSGRAGIAYWINSYLKLDDAHKIYEDHEAVRKIKDWLDEQVNAGEFGEVPDGEILEQVRRYL